MSQTTLEYIPIMFFLHCSPGLCIKVSGENITLQVTESLSNLTRNKLNSTLKSKELNSQSQLPLKITWL